MCTRTMERLRWVSFREHLDPLTKTISPRSIKAQANLIWFLQRRTKRKSKAIEGIKVPVDRARKLAKSSPKIEIQMIWTSTKLWLTAQISPQCTTQRSTVHIPCGPKTRRTLEWTKQSLSKTQLRNRVLEWRKAIVTQVRMNRASGPQAIKNNDQVR